MDSAAAASDRIELADVGTAGAVYKGPASASTKTALAHLSPDGIRFVAAGKTYRPDRRAGAKLRNNLLLAVGFLELANAGDFAANVWNEIPVPIHAAVLMGIGGTLALVMVWFAAKDASLSWANWKALRAERRMLTAQLAAAAAAENSSAADAIAAVLDMNFREMGSELVDRVGMDICMGFGALVVGVGTLMAIGGADPDVFNASNLLSGYIGNAPCALYGLVNMAWSAYVWLRARRQRRAGLRSGTLSAPVQTVLKMRTSAFKMHSALNGTTGAVAGAASLVTATMWWGYVVLLPCIVMSVLANIFWRRRVGYNRPLFHQQGAMPPFAESDLTDELRHVNQLRQRACIDRSDPLPQLVSDPESSACVVAFVARNQLFEEFCAQVLLDRSLTSRLLDCAEHEKEVLTIKPADLIFPSEHPLNSQVVMVAKRWLARSVLDCLNDRERYLAELLGCFLSLQ